MRSNWISGSGCAVGLMLALAAAANPDEGEVLWRHPCEDTERVSAGEHVTLSNDSEAQYHKEGAASLKAVLARRPGMLEDDWNGFYNITWRLKPFEIQKGDRLRLWYMMDKCEPFYPCLRLHLYDKDNTRLTYVYNKGTGQERFEAAGQWLPVDIDLSEGKQSAKGEDGKMGPAVRILVSYNYRPFKEFEDYVRWFDDMRIVRKATTRESVRNTPFTLK